MDSRALGGHQRSRVNSPESSKVREILGDLNDGPFLRMLSRSMAVEGSSQSDGLPQFLSHFHQYLAKHVLTGAIAAIAPVVVVLGVLDQF